jgi:hypothetical protein
MRAAVGPPGRAEMSCGRLPTSVSELVGFVDHDVVPAINDPGIPRRVA